MPSCERVLGCPLAARRNAGLRVGGGRGKCPFHYLLKRFTFASSSQLTYALYSFFHLDSSFTPAHLYEIKRPLIIIIFLLPCRKLNAVPCLWFRTGHQTTATPTKPSPEKQKGSVLCGEGGKGLPRPVGVHADAVRQSAAAAFTCPAGVRPLLPFCPQPGAWLERASSRRGAGCVRLGCDWGRTVSITEYFPLGNVLSLCHLRGALQEL